MERKRPWSRTTQIIAASVVFVVLIASVLIAQRPYLVFASTSSCVQPVETQIDTTIAVDGPATMVPGAVYTVTVGADDSVSTYSSYELGFAVLVAPSTANHLTNPVQVDQKLVTQADVLTPTTLAHSVQTWTAPDTLFDATYQFVPVVVANGSVLVQKSTDPITRVAHGTAALSYLIGAQVIRYEAASSKIVSSVDDTAQQFAEYTLENPTNTPQDISIHWTLSSGEAGSFPLLRNEATYTQTIQPGISVSRPFFIDTSLISNGLVQAAMTAGGLETTQAFRLYGKAAPNILISKVTQNGRKIGEMGSAQFLLCFQAGDTVAQGAAIHLTLTDSSHTTVYDKTLTGSELKTGQYEIREYALVMHWPLLLTASTTVNGKEVSRHSNTYQP